MSTYTINNVNLVGGNLTRDAELRYTNSGSAVANFSVALGRAVKVGEKWEEKTDFFKVILWGKQAEALAKYLTKGTKVAVEGRLSQNRWQNPEGKNMSSVEVVAFNIILMGSPKKQDHDEGGYEQGNYQPPPQQYETPEIPQYGEPAQQGYGGGYNNPDLSKELPF